MSAESSSTSPKRKVTKRKVGLWASYQRQPGWKKALLAIGTLLLVAGAVFQIMAWIDPPQIPSSGQGGSLTGSLVENQGGTSGADYKSSEEAWSEGFFKLGFSFFAGFAIGSFVRGFLKVFLFVAGGILLLLFGLEYAGVTNIDWNMLDRWFDSARDKIIGESSSFREFISSRLPSGAMAGIGIFSGFKRG